jgi:sec-independent protein translocase protein TatA
MSFGPEWFVVIGIIVLLFGAKKLPELARSMGKASNEFKQGLKEGATPEPTDESAESSKPTGSDGPIVP